MDILLIMRALRKNKLGAILIGLQIALTLAIVCNSLSVIQQFMQRMHRPTGIDEANIFTLSSVWIADPPDLKAQIEGDLAALRALPGVVDAISAISVPLDGMAYNSSLSLKSDQRSPTAWAATYFADEHGQARIRLQVDRGALVHCQRGGLAALLRKQVSPDHS